MAPKQSSGGRFYIVGTAYDTSIIGAAGGYATLAEAKEGAKEYTEDIKEAFERDNDPVFILQAVEQIEPADGVKFTQL